MFSIFLSHVSPLALGCKRSYSNTFSMAWNLVKGDSKCAHLNSRKMAAAMKAYFLDIPEYQ